MATHRAAERGIAEAEDAAIHPHQLIAPSVRGGG
jgi:hypothetical protein